VTTINCPNCGLELSVDIQALLTSGEITILRGRKKAKSTSGKAQLRKTKTVNIICTECGFEFVVPVEEENVN
jgi:predicted RNA-binding Zn-ribbon protein involved in translation (DUF1610 family)